MKAKLKNTVIYTNNLLRLDAGCMAIKQLKHCMLTNMSLPCGLFNYYDYNHFTTLLCPGLPRWAGIRRINHSGFCRCNHDGVAVASAEPYASYLHFAPEDNHASTSSLRFLRAGCPSWHSANSVKALKATIKESNMPIHWLNIHEWTCTQPWLQAALTNDRMLPTVKPAVPALINKYLFYAMF